MLPLNQDLKNRLGESHHRRLREVEVYHPRKLFFSGDTKEYLHFSSNDYLGLSQKNISVKNRYQPSSRLLSGHTRQFAEAESALASWLGRSRALIYSTGYMANVGLVSSLLTRGDSLYLDRYVHASLVDGAKLSGAKIYRYAHLNFEHLERLLRADEGKGRRWVVTESLFSMDGDIPDFKKLKELKRKWHFSLIVDEAHAMGVYGSEGRGILSEAKYKNLADIITFTLSKSFALQGGVVLGSKALIEFLIEKSRPLIYTTALPASLGELICKRLKQVRSAESQRKKLRELCLQVEGVFKTQRDAWSPIFPIVTGEEKATLQLSQSLKKNGIYCPAILPPTVASGACRLRLSLTALHKKEDLLHLSEYLASYIKAKSS